MGRTGDKGSDTSVKQAFAWIGRKAFLYIALFVAILGGWWLHSSYQSFGDIGRRTEALQAAKADLAQYRDGLTALSDASVQGFQSYGKDELARRSAEAAAEKQRLDAQCATKDLGALLSGGVGGVIENRKACLRSAIVARELDSLTALQASFDARRPNESVSAALSRQAVDLDQAAVELKLASAALDKVSGDYIPDALQVPEIQRQSAIIRDQRAIADQAKRNVSLLKATQFSLSEAATKSTAALTGYYNDYAGLVAGQEQALGDTALQKLSVWAKSNNVTGALKAAAIALFFILISPFLIRLFCYHVLARIIEGRPPIRIVAPPVEEAPLPSAPPSRTSVSIALEPNEELLVRQGYFQSASRASDERTQWFLDPAHPIMSFATGLSFLTRIRGAGQAITVSAIHDPFAEVTLLTLPEGAACVLHPRAIAAVAEPIDKPLRIVAHWRIFSLHAWLTGQWRYYVFHGPARLVLKGGRGVRVEQVERGRIFAQSQLIGFSADIPYAVVRTGTFWPYFLGREPLLKDRVEGDTGILIVEEAPMIGRKGETKTGIEGMLDAGLKLFGM